MGIHCKKVFTLTVAQSHEILHQSNNLPITHLRIRGWSFPDHGGIMIGQNEIHQGPMKQP